MKMMMMMIGPEPSLMKTGSTWRRSFNRQEIGGNCTPHASCHLLFSLQQSWPFLISYICTAYILPSCTQTFVVSCLLGTLAFTTVICVANVVAAKSIVALLLAIAKIGILTCYICTVWHMIPFCFCKS